MWVEHTVHVSWRNNKWESRCLWFALRCASFPAAGSATDSVNLHSAHTRGGSYTIRSNQSNRRQHMVAAHGTPIFLRFCSFCWANKIFRFVNYIFVTFTLCRTLFHEAPAKSDNVRAVCVSVCVCVKIIGALHRRRQQNVKWQTAKKWLALNLAIKRIRMRSTKLCALEQAEAGAQFICAKV